MKRKVFTMVMSAAIAIAAAGPAPAATARPATMNAKGGAFKKTAADIERPTQCKIYPTARTHQSK